jgi:hypothetical protein
MASKNKELAFIYTLVREDGCLERVCKHGIGHTVGHVDRRKIVGKYFFIHGCDGCCDDYELMAPLIGSFE